MGLKTWWQKITKEEYALIITVPGDTKTDAEGNSITTTKEKRYIAKKIVKSTPKHFIFIDLDDRKHEIKYLNPVDFHIIKIW